MDMLKEIYNIGIIPVIKIMDAKKAVPLAKALLDGGLAAAEITFRTDAAEESIRAITKAYPDMLVGAGTVLTIEQAERAKNAVRTMLGLSVCHIGINHENEADAKKTAEMFSLLLGCPAEKESEKGLFVTDQLEILKGTMGGKCGHIGIKTNNVERAIYHLSLRGIEFKEETATFNADGTRNFIYLKEEFGGFSIHLLQA